MFVRRPGVIPGRADGEGPRSCSAGLLAPRRVEGMGDWQVAEAAGERLRDPSPSLRLRKTAMTLPSSAR
ncbi:MAG: hypothetical protein DMF06_07460 [Verrucomicrobia bacterium]|nr:MAG: hypothetical protein DMF06_07460 [Verrucomicrobiota bacterium]